ncbi:AzlC family ABC transporter permease [Bradyrhizobium sp. SBR1B]|uniref:AzlC family ABC transporter permease n=1 Tax=Bradyrhizobium sp. SBR1B TaxID=2663836 RepID=UPI001605B4AD|nr:AzlC family ABC transporter permease [Bradyrhizobium sp. SBR1B]MBB4381945.1 4-azaleucine resistance transporter AzlC [Bradyrhizobium sp. SBR1B]
MISFVPFALVLGAQATRKGIDGAVVPMMTALNFGGGSEFAAVELWTSPPHVALIVAITLLINSRHILMGAVLSPYLRTLPRHRALSALFFMCDESWAMGLADARKRSDRFSVPYYLGVSLGLYFTWVSFTAAGAVLGPVIGDPTTLGLDMAFPAVFLVMLRGMWKGPVAARSWAVSLFAAVGTYLMVPGAWYVVSGALAGVVAAYLLRERVR